MISYLIIIASIVLTGKAINALIDTANLVRHKIQQRQQLKRITNDHPELRQADLDDLLVFSIDDYTRSMILNNEDEADNIPMLIKVFDEQNDDDVE